MLKTRMILISLFFLFLSHPARSQEPKPLDPLTAQETETALRVARSDPKVKELIGSARSNFIAVQFFAVKPTETSPNVEVEASGRHAEVLFYRYDNNKGIRALVDVQRSATMEVTEVDGRTVPLGTEEIKQAVSLALRNDSVIKFLGPSANQYKVRAEPSSEDQAYGVDTLRVVAASEKDACWNHRCVSLLFRQKGFYRVGTSVIVDLTSQRVFVERSLK